MSDAIITPIEKKVLIKICEQKTAKQISYELGLSTRTIEKHKENLMIKLDVKSMIGLALYAVKSNIYN